MTFEIVAALLLALAGEAWRYTSDLASGAALRVLPVTTTRPEDVEERVTYQGQVRYAQLRYGSPGSTRVAIAVDVVSPVETHLFVDANRDRVLDQNDLVGGAGPEWQVGVAAAVMEDGKATFAPRSLRFRSSLGGKLLSYADAGCLEGRVKMDAGEVVARRIDGDGNGQFADPQDRLLLDLDHDGAFGVSEQFLFAPLLAIGERRFSVHSDAYGNTLRLEAVSGMGAISCALARAAAGTVVRSLAVSMVARDGSAYLIEGAGVPLAVPVGSYRIACVTMGLANDAFGRPIEYVFSDDGGRDTSTWYRVERDRECSIDPIGGLEFKTGVSGSGALYSPGELITVRPQLFTRDGLVINSCSMMGARIVLKDVTGAVVASTSSGFA